MVQQTPVYGWRYRELTDPPNLAAATAELAADIEADVQALDAASDARLDTIEAALGAVSWSTWSPTFGGFTLGNGVVETARYRSIAGVVNWRLRIVMGSTSSFSGLFVISLPIAPPVPNDTPVGHGYVNDATLTANRTLVVAVRNSGGTGFHMLAPGGTVSNASPFAWAQSDSLSLAGAYPAAA